MVMSTSLIVDAPVVGAADPLTEAKNQIAVLHLQAARLKQERDEARADNQVWHSEFMELLSEAFEANEQRDGAFKQAGDLSERMMKAVGLDWIKGPCGGGRIPDDKDIIAAAEKNLSDLIKAQDVIDDLKETVTALELQAKERAILVRNVTTYWRDAEEEVVEYEYEIEHLRGLIRVLQSANRMLSAMAGFVEIPVGDADLGVA